MRATTAVFSAVLVVAGLAACSSTGSRLWLPQSPGNVTDEGLREAAARPPAKTQPLPARSESAVAAVTAPSAPGPSVARAGGPPQPGAAMISQDAAAPGAYTQVTRYGDLYFLSGQIGIDLASGRWDASANAEQQTRVAMENVRRVLEGERLTMANVISVTVYLRSLNDFRLMNDAYEPFFRTSLPARTVVEVSRLPRDALVEISVVAGR